MIGVLNCANKIKFTKNAPIDSEEAYVQSWNGGIQEAGSGINIYIKTIDQSIRLDSVYFRGKSAKLVSSSKNSLLYKGSFKNENKTLKSLSKSNRIRFNLKDNEAVVRYTEGQHTFYFKIANIKERQSLNYPTNESFKQ
jgi:hypothetical protein